MPSNKRQKSVQELSKAQGKWPSILAGMCDPQLLDRKHHPCPFCEGKDRFRFIDNEGDGFWMCNQCTPNGGDGIGLVMRLNNCQFPQALKMIEPLVGGAAVTHRPQRSTKEIGEDIMRVWNHSPRNDASMEWYLKTRGINLSQIGKSHALRGVDKLPFYTDGKKVKEMPAMLAQVTTREGAVAAVHRTYFANTSEGVKNNKKLTKANPTVNGCSIKLYEPKEDGVLGIAEGVETALACRQLYYDKTGKLMPVWATISAHGMELVHIPSYVKRVVIFGDNDMSYTGQKSAYTLANRIVTRPPNLEALVHIPLRPDEDWNDVLLSNRSE